MSASFANPDIAPPIPDAALRVTRSALGSGLGELLPASGILTNGALRNTRPTKASAARRVALKNQIAATTEQLKSATTDAEVQKLQGVLIGLTAAFNNTDYEINQATASALVQDVANRNDAQRQIEAKKEQQHAEFTEAVQKYGQTFRLMNAPTAFPTP